MHVLVSGANGYFGSVTVAALAASTKISKITALVRASERFGAGESSLFPDKTSIVDVKDLLSGQFKMDGIDAICHLAAARDSQKTSDITESLQFTSALASRAIQFGVPRFINASTQAIYGVRPPVWYEADSVAPVTPYGKSKEQVEEIMLTASRGNAAFKTISLRFAKLVGPSPKFRISPSELPHLFAYCALNGKTLSLPDDGKQKWDLMDVRDAAGVIVSLLDIPQQDWPDVMNVGSGHQATTLEVAELVDRVARHEIGEPFSYQLEALPGRALRNYGMSIDRLRELLDWVPRYALEDTIRDIIALLTHTRHRNSHENTVG